MNTAIVWFRRDLRLSDNPALHHAVKNFSRVVLVYIHAPDEAAPWTPGSVFNLWQHHSLNALKTAIAEKGGRLIIRHGPSLEALQTLIHETGADAVYWNRLYEPILAARDQDISEVLREQGVTCHSCNGSLLFEPWRILTRDGVPYRVFTPFWRRCLKQGLDEECLPTPAKLHTSHLPSVRIKELDLIPEGKWYTGVIASWKTGEAAAQARLDRFCEEELASYANHRDHPALASTSRLSPHLAHGEISTRQIIARLQEISTLRRAAGLLKGAEQMSRELGWREFAYHILHHFPHTCDGPLDPRYMNFPWRDDPELVRAWKHGHTGFPLIDAGMRELWQTGWMHNRVRMVSASLLTRNGLVEWRHGARWFWETLLDADLACNTLNWQWAAGCGADAAPYFRIFNPIRQSERFDKTGDYIRRWLPELLDVPQRWIHTPWKQRDETPRDYPAPIFDLAITRQRAIETTKEQFRQQKGQGK